MKKINSFLMTKILVAKYVVSLQNDCDISNPTDVIRAACRTPKAIIDGKYLRPQLTTPAVPRPSLCAPN